MYSVAFIGTGPNPDSPVWGESAAMAYHHANGYQVRDDCELVACADLVPENAEAFADEFGMDQTHVYEDYLEMLDTVEPDFVSISTPVPTHASIVLDCLETNIPEAIHCEKPMATTWGDARLMAQEASRRDIQLTFNHQRRMASPWRDAKDLLDSGAIGSLERIELSCGELLDNGTHFIDIANMFNDDRQAEWVIGGIDYRKEHVKYGAHNENQAIAQWAYANGVHGLAATGHGSELLSATVRILGSEGIIEITPHQDEVPPLRYMGPGTDGWEGVSIEETDVNAITLAIEHIVESLSSGEEPELSARCALSATEVIFATYESARRNGRVDLPLRIEDNPLEAMVKSGELMLEDEE